MEKEERIAWSPFRPRVTIWWPGAEWTEADQTANKVHGSENQNRDA